MAFKKGVEKKKGFVLVPERCREGFSTERGRARAPVLELALLFPRPQVHREKPESWDARGVVGSDALPGHVQNSPKWPQHFAEQLPEGFSPFLEGGCCTSKKASQRM